jgi:multiple sugar transport system permease protein
VSLLPYIITPVIGALSIRWLFVGDGILTAAVSALAGQKVYLLAQGWSLELLMLFYRVWHVAPFAFIVFYAGLQTVDQDTLESAVIDGASRLERLRYVVLPQSCTAHNVRRLDPPDGLVPRL